jgi:polyisoprenoid-binding protein YceI
MTSHDRRSAKAPRMLLAAAASVILLAAAAGAAPETYEVRPGDGTGIVFESKAPLETFEGRTGQVTGWCRFDPDDLAAGAELEISVDLASFDTGMGKRNEHMRENHLETDRFPLAHFRGGRIEGAGTAAPATLPAGGSATLVLHGTLDLHGVSREMSCEVRLSRDHAGALSVAAEFPVKLSDHDIERPKFLVMKLSDDQQVRVALKMEATP